MSYITSTFEMTAPLTKTNKKCIKIINLRCWMVIFRPLDCKTRKGDSPGGFSVVLYRDMSCVPRQLNLYKLVLR